MQEGRQVNFFTVTGEGTLVQLGYFDNVPHQSNEPLGFRKDATGKFWYILWLDQAVLDDLRIPGNGGQRGFQLMGNVGGKFAAELFPLLLLFVPNTWKRF